MKTVSIINLKGGVAKTLTTVSMAYALSQQYNARVLVVDNDKQGNCSKTFGVHSYDRQSIADLMLDRDADLAEVIQHTKYDRIDVIPANMTLLTANMQVMMDSSRPQQTRLRTALRKVADLYDYCLIDNAPDINISTVNALVASDEAVIPVKIDSYAFDGLIELKNQIEITARNLIRDCGLPVALSPASSVRPESRPARTGCVKIWIVPSTRRTSGTAAR